MKLYLKIVMWMIFFVANCYGLKLIFAAMTYPSDFTFFGGLCGLGLLLLTDYMIIVRVSQDPPPKSDAGSATSTPPEDKGAL